jgi:Metallo-beta-lactamase superfamily
MIFSLEVRRARSGDCLILHYGTPADPGLLLVDGGPAQVYAQFLRPRLDALKTKRQKDGEEDVPLPIDAVMVSHIDDDHINGILELTSELVIAKDAKKPALVKIRSFWHNTFDDIIGNSPKELTAAVTAHFGAAALAGEPDTEGLDQSAAMVLSSVGQGIRLRDDVRKLGLKANEAFGERLVMATAGGGVKNVGKGLSMTVLGPAKLELEALQKEHDDFLKKQQEHKPSSLAAFTDTSVPNLSSIVVLAEVNKKRILLTGDARGDKVLSGLELTGAVAPGGTIDIDVLKMPHHGSARNMDRPFLDRIRAKHYVFSGNGQHGNPDRETLEMLGASALAADALIHLTYPIDEIDEERKKDWIKEQRKEIARKAKNPQANVREEWSPPKHSLAAFFAARPDMANRVRIVPANDPHVIDLLDPL